MSKFCGLDIGTNMIVAGITSDDNEPVFRMERDAYYKIIPKSDLNKNSIKTSLEKRGVNFVIDGNEFIIVGNDALDIAVERNDVSERPMKKGVVSPKDKNSLPIIKLIIKTLLGTGSTGDIVAYSIPAKPIDNNFDITYHSEIMGMYLKELGYKALPINESFAVALSELVDYDLSGIALSFGAGQVNICVIHQGEPIVEFSLTKSGDYIDESVGIALDVPTSFVQMEKEAGVDLINPKGKIMEAIVIYYRLVIKYAIDNMANELNKRVKDLPKYKEGVPLVVSGGLTLAEGFVDVFESLLLEKEDFPIKISKVIRADNPITSVANGAMMASQL